MMKKVIEGERDEHRLTVHGFSGAYTANAIHDTSS
jgi:hypothetical protein